MPGKSEQVTNLEECKAALRDAEKALAAALKRESKQEDAHRKETAELVHELRTPLTAIAGFCEIMKDETFGPLGNDAYREPARIVHEAALQLLEMCERVLPAAADDIVLPPPTVADVDVGDLAGQVVELFSAMALQRGVHIVAEVVPDFPILKTDPLRLRQVLANLVSNAIKFTPAGGRVTVKSRVDSQEGVAILIVQDQGRGIPAEKIVSILRGMSMLMPTAKDAGASPHGDRGSGLGLQIAYRLVQELGGRLEIVSKETVGTIVSIKFPLSMTTPKRR
ncbi:MAG: HAMP domain-containing histidine kinase [Rhodospirillales bacterium]|nr:HAMP domain-containing histidine kinase [Rhodospirillales bacterium]